MKRMQIKIPEKLKEEIWAISMRENCSYLQIIQNLVKYGLLVYSIGRDPKCKLMITEEGKTPREIIII